MTQIVVTAPKPVQMEGQTNEIGLDSIAHNMIVTADILKEAHKWTDNQKKRKLYEILCDL
eukprot:6737-Heterococcus_DN1.PRE.2